MMHSRVPRTYATTHGAHTGGTIPEVPQIEMSISNSLNAPPRYREKKNDVNYAAVVFTHEQKDNQ